MNFTNEVTYTSHKEHKGFDITIYEMKRGDYIVDVIDKEGIRHFGWEFVNSFNCALMKAVNFIDHFTSKEMEGIKKRLDAAYKEQ